MRVEISQENVRDQLEGCCPLLEVGEVESKGAPLRAKQLETGFEGEEGPQSGKFRCNMREEKWEDKETLPLSPSPCRSAKRKNRRKEEKYQKSRNF